MKQTWRLVDTGHLTAAENMALDEVLLTLRSKGGIPNTLRFLQFSPKCVLVGLFQDVEQEVRIDYCKANNIEINRRITGGGGLYWDESAIGWEIYANKDNPLFPNNIENLYAKICQGVVQGLSYLGVNAQFRPRNDIEVDGRKISGTGGTELDGAFLFQGTLLVDYDVNTMLKTLKIPIEKLKNKEIESAKERVNCLKWILGYVPDAKTIKSAIAKGFSDVFSIDFVEGTLMDQEKKMLKERLPLFKSDEWIYKVRKTEEQRKVLQSIYKGNGGLIRTSLVMDVPGRRIKSALITGDFFVYPGRVINDLEADLKDLRADKELIRKTVEQRFLKSNAKMVGLTKDDFIFSILEALGDTAK